MRLSADEFARCERALLRPVPRVALGLRLRGLASAAIDLSDGLTGDLGHLLRASGVGARVDLAAIARDPALDRQLHGSQRTVALRCLLAGGDDYELCFSAPAARDPDVAALGGELDIELSRIGEVTAATQLVVHDEAGRALSSLPAAFDHFSP